MPFSTVLLTGLSLLSGAVASFPSGPGNGGPGSVRELVISNKKIALDGFSRSAIVAGGTFPGVPILATKGERLQINVVDQLADSTMLRSTSVHWHGIFQSGTPYNDGTAFVSQCPIAANNSFLYDFTPSKQAGTFWYHSHLSLQYCDGLRGPLIIYDPEDPHRFLYDVDDASTIITLADWFHTPSRNAPLGYFYTTNTINGHGRFTNGSTTAPLAVINVFPGLSYRFRLISMSCEPSFNFSIDGHPMTIIEADGVSVSPLVVDQINVSAGQRYSFVLYATQRIDNYWIRSVPSIGDTTFKNGVNSAVLRYFLARDCEPEVPKTVPVIKKPLVETNLHPLVATPVPGQPHPGGADVSLTINIGLDFATFQYLLNNVSFTPPNAPALLQILSGAQQASALLPKGSYYSLPPNKVIEINIPGSADPGAPHPFHLHGHNFFVVRSAGSTTYNYKNPVIRDVVSTGGPADNVTFRFVTDNAGPWMLHCHIDTHLEIGMAVILAEDIPDIQKETVPTSWKNLCPLYNSLNPNQL